MKKIYPDKLIKGDTVAVIAPSRTLPSLTSVSNSLAIQRFRDLGLNVIFGKHTEESDEFNSSKLESRLQDLHESFSNKKVKAIVTAIGGFNSNQLLEYIDWKIIKSNPKILCGYSDITALSNAIFSKTGLVTYYGPHFSDFNQKLYFEYTLDYFKKCLISEDIYKVTPSKKWSNDKWYIDQDKRLLHENDGQWTINKGIAEGTIVGGNLCTLNLLQGTEFMPMLRGSVLFLEDDDEPNPFTFDRNIQSLIQLPTSSGIKGMVIGRFEKESKMSQDILYKIIKTKVQLKDIPVIANVDFGHTDPKITFPIGGICKLEILENTVNIMITKH